MVNPTHTHPMTAICTCKNAHISARSGLSEPYCTDCGHYWIEKYGSTKPDGKSPRCPNKYETIQIEKARHLAMAASLLNRTPKPSRNFPCPCGSGKKYKKCCLSK